MNESEPIFCLDGLSASGQEEIIEVFDSQINNLKESIQCKCKNPRIEMKYLSSDPLGTQIKMRVSCKICGVAAQITHNTIPAN
jgi:hypothetical protein